MMKNISKLVVAAFVVGAFCSLDLMAQGNEKGTSPIKGVGVVIKHNTKREVGPVTFCWSPDEQNAAVGSKQKAWQVGNLPGHYKLKVWQVTAGQTSETAMRTNLPIIEKEVKDQTQSAVITPAGCTESSQQAEGMRYIKSNLSEPPGTRPNGAQTRTNKSSITVPFAVENIPVCESGSTCDYVWAVEIFDAEGKSLGMSSPQTLNW